MTKNTIDSLNKISIDYFDINYSELLPDDLRNELSKVDLSIFDEAVINKAIDVNFEYELIVEKISGTLYNYAREKLEKSKLLGFLLELGKALNNLGTWKISEKYFNVIVELTKDEKPFIDYVANSYLSLGEIYFRQANWKTSFENLEKAKEIFSTEKFHEGLIRTNNMIGAVFGEKGEFTSAEKYFLESLELIENKDHFNLLTGMVEDNIGLINFSRSLYDEAFAYFNRSLQIFDSFSARNRLSEAHFNIGLVYQKKKNYDSALVEFDNSLKNAIESEYISMLNLNLSVKANLTLDTDDFDQSIAFLNKSMELSKKINDRLTIADLYKIKGLLSKKMKKKREAEKYFFKSLRMNKELDNKFNYYETLYELGQLYKEWNKTDLAMENLTKAFNYKKSIGAENAAKEIKLELNKLHEKH